MKGYYGWQNDFQDDKPPEQDESSDLGHEGWGRPGLSTKWHYFIDGQRSLCGKWESHLGELEEGNDTSPDNCAECKRQLKQRNRQYDKGDQ